MPFAAAEAELWKPVSANEMYLVSSLGRVRSLRTGRILRNSPRVNGYISASLSSDSGHKTRFYVHRLVAEAFCGGCPEGMTVNHINFNRSDNRAANLEVVTHRQNVDHSLAAGRYQSQGVNAPVGSLSAASKLDEVKVREIRRQYAAGATMGALAKSFGVVKQQISNIVNRVSWKHVA